MKGRAQRESECNGDDEERGRRNSREMEEKAVKRGGREVQDGRVEGGDGEDQVPKGRT